ncbi:small ubiquitin-related modifier 2-like [Melanaphis sacchari]|uniref:small ubiquitin-related modifier 2-like n=1 Tax=Melanaphis sacchari TaxID=742174 RepID=UPI000DC14590|nr:small ubiquitin-related modifier 2-like [Melanaphis sacchari]
MSSERGSEYTTILVQPKREISSAICIYKIKNNKPLKILMEKYCLRIGLNRESVRFLASNNVINEDDTVSSLNLENYSIIQVLRR